jgi:Tfp pilus assembly protein PilO
MAKKKNNNVVVVLLVLLVGVGIFANVLQWRNLQQVRERVQEEEQMLELAQTRLVSLRQLALRQEVMAEDLDLLMQMMPGEPQEDVLILDLQSGADLSRMNFKHIRFGGRTQGEGYVEMPLDAAFVGTYHELLHFLDYLTLYERAVRIEELRVDAVPDTNQMSVNIRASAFYAAE